MKYFVQFLYLLSTFYSSEASKSNNEVYIEDHSVQVKQLPKLGACWKFAFLQLESDCRDMYLDVQIQFTLYLTDCFLESSGYEPSNCGLDKKSNLQKICISSMPNKVYFAYTEFFTYTTDLCYFLREQVWHDVIINNMFKIGIQLNTTVHRQQEIIESLESILKMQENILMYGEELEKLLGSVIHLNIQHNKMLKTVNKGVSGLQIWITNELAWVDIIVFYVGCFIWSILVTSSNVAKKARLPILFLVFVSLLIEQTVLILESKLNLQFSGYTVIFRSRHMVLLCSVIWILRVMITCDTNLETSARNLDLMYEQNLLMDMFIERIYIYISSQFSRNVQISSKTQRTDNKPKKTSVKFENLSTPQASTASNLTNTPMRVQQYRLDDDSSSTSLDRENAVVKEVGTVIHKELSPSKFTAENQSSGNDNKDSEASSSKKIADTPKRMSEDQETKTKLIMLRKNYNLRRRRN